MLSLSSHTAKGGQQLLSCSEEVRASCVHGSCSPACVLDKVLSSFKLLTYFGGSTVTRQRENLLMAAATATEMKGSQYKLC